MKKLLSLAALSMMPGVTYSRPIRTPDISDLGVSFEKSFGEQIIHWGSRDPKDKSWCSRLALRYEAYKPLLKERNSEPLIPKKIHQIWLGNPLPKKFEEMVKSWAAMHPGWEYKLWSEKDIEAFGLANQKAYDAATNLGQKSDIARLEILDRLGGIYVDCDFECTMPFDELVHRYSFFAGISSGVYVFEVNNALIAAAPGHPILRSCIDNLSLETEHRSLIARVVETTGPAFFTRHIMALEAEMGDDMIIFPCSYFYPLAQNQKGNIRRSSYMKKETFGVHHWGGSWNRPTHFTKGLCNCRECKQERWYAARALAKERTQKKNDS